MRDTDQLCRNFYVTPWVMQYILFHTLFKLCMLFFCNILVFITSYPSLSHNFVLHIFSLFLLLCSFLIFRLKKLKLDICHCDTIYFNSGNSECIK